MLNKIKLWQKNIDCLVKNPFFFAENASIACGGYSPAAFYPRTETALAELVQKLNGESLPFYTLGNMTNVLPPEGACKRLIVCTKSMKSAIKEKNTLYVSAGVTSGELLRACKRYGLSGAEFTVGIPCTMGGLLYMNGGAGGVYVSEIVENVRALYQGEVVALSNAECQYAYKSSVFMREDLIILGATLKLTPSDTDGIARRIARFSARRAGLPKGRSMGCVFKNPDGDVAGRLIEQAGLKGFRVGGAYISQEHANFIINDGRATVSQIKQLITIIKNAVNAQYKKQLQEEIVYLI